MEEKIIAFVDSEPLTILWLTQSGCNICRMIFPQLEDFLKGEFPFIPLLKVELDHYPQIASTYGVSAVPTLLVMTGPQEAYRQARFIRLNELREKLIRLNQLMKD